MTPQTFYPVFEHGQVLTSSQLNTMVDYLEQQDRLSRRTLSGIGIVCGFDLDRDGTAVEISRGVAVTSAGYLVTSEAQRYDRVRPYELPVPTAETASPDEIAEARYPFLFGADGNQIPLLELVDTDFVPAPGEDDPRAIAASDLDGAVVMLFLEAERAALKSCDVNDCSDKGAERRFALRRLLLTRAQAEAIVAQETEIAGRPVDRARHPRLELPYLRIEKLALARDGVDNFAAFVQRIMTIAQKLAGELPGALRGAYDAYGHLLRDIYDDGVNPFPDGYFGNVWGQVANNLFLAQYFYDYLRDVGMAYNEFADAAVRFENECLPGTDRFPRHVLLGDLVDVPGAFAADFKSPADVAAFDPLGATAGAGLPVRPLPRRTHWVPSPAHQGPALADVRALFIRMHLLALTFDLDGRLVAPIRITPSRDGAAPLSERAIPFYYAFDRTSDLFRNWSPDKTRANRLNAVYSYALNPPDAEHPLAFRIDDQDFYRVEGVVGKPLGTAMAQLIAWKRELALSFAIEPVYMRLSTGRDDVDGSEIDIQALATLAQVLRQLLLCRMSDFDALLLTLLRTLFALLVFIVRGVAAALADLQAQIDEANAGIDTGATPGGIVGTFRPGDLVLNTGREAIVVNRLATGNLAATRFIADLPPEEQEALKQDAALIQKQLQGRTPQRGDAIKLAVPEARPESIGAVYEAVRNDAAGGNLFDRTKSFVERRGGGDEETQVVYAQVAMLDQGDQLMRVLNVDRLADLNTQAFDIAYRGFAGAYRNYARVVGAMPEKAGTTPEATVQIVSAADTVASEGTAFAVSNLQDEIGRAVSRVLGGLTLDRFASRHPGLEHGAGVPKGGTLVLAYVGRVELERHLAAITGKFRKRSESIASILGSNVALDIRNALQELQKAVGTRTDEPLDDYVVLADFCLPYLCCDSDCSDAELSERILADPFGRGLDPAPMAVPPYRGESPRPVAGASEAFVPAPPVVVVARPARVRPAGDLSAFERPPGIDAILRGRLQPTPPPDPSRPTPGPTEDPVAPVPEPSRPSRPSPEETAVLFGQVVTGTGRNQEPVPGAQIIVELPTGDTQTQTANRQGSFKFRVPSGEMRIRAAFRNFSGRRQTVSVEPGEERELTLRLTPRP